jgi:glycosyltransferase involved in cell wall biosynthesis
MPVWKPFGEAIGMFQRGLLRYILKEKPDAIIASANPRYLSFWTTLAFARLRNIQFHAHGHGLYNSTPASKTRRLAMKCMLRLITSYIAYGPIVRESFAANGLSKGKVEVAHNSLVNEFTVRPDAKTGLERGILFLGRLRPESNIDRLLQAVKLLREEDKIDATVHLVGSGEDASRLRQEWGGHHWIEWHGSLFDDQAIRAISMKCLAGCYPGNAGLSVVHLMSLSLPVVTHDELSKHGPEPSFMRDGQCGYLYSNAGGVEALREALRRLYSQTSKTREMQHAAFNNYQSLVNPSLAERLWGIVSRRESQLQEQSLVART